MYIDQQKGVRKEKSKNSAIYKFLEKVYSRMDRTESILSLHMDLNLGIRLCKP